MCRLLEYTWIAPTWPAGRWGLTVFFVLFIPGVPRLSAFWNISPYIYVRALLLWLSIDNFSTSLKSLGVTWPRRNWQWNEWSIAISSHDMILRELYIARYNETAGNGCSNNILRWINKHKQWSTRILTYNNIYCNRITLVQSIRAWFL